MRNRDFIIAGVLFVIMTIGAVPGCGKKSEKTGNEASTSEAQPGSARTEQPAATGQGTAADTARQGTLPATGAEPAGREAGGAAPQPSGAGQTPPAGAPPSTNAGRAETPSAGPQPNAGNQPPPDTARTAAAAPGASGNFKYVGVMACAMCHRGASKGSIYEVWQASDHAKAYENLGAENQKNPVCLGCHTTGYGKALAANVTPDKMVNVQCEACHGPGSEYKVMAVMKNRPQALEKGLILPTEKVCMGCHGGKFPEGHPTVAFNYASALLKIEHHSKPTE